jgi:hypothetical protein
MEIWKPIRFCTGYEVSNLGRVRSLDRVVIHKDGHKQKRRGLILKLVPAGTYLVVTLKRGAQNSTVHCLVADAFIGRRPRGKQVAHNDGNPHNNRADNLRYVTVKENQEDMVAHGRSQRGVRNVNNKLKLHQVLEIKKLLQSFTQRDIAARYGVSQASINHISVGKTWGWL